ncbi:MAG: GNAT family N-acetyltransferase [Anaerolineae bacterium]|nr:GNAT family N-acetyltransferase [Anaerolineae bacterium]
MSDDMINPTEDSVISLREVTKENLSEVLTLKVKPDQQRFVASNAVSIAEAHFEEKAWYRAVYADETPIGFVMLYDDPKAGEYYLWRMMIDARYQGHHFGERALRLLIEYIRTRPGAVELLVSYVPIEGNPQPFYRRLGFVDTGELSNGENVMRLVL